MAMERGTGARSGGCGDKRGEGGVALRRWVRNDHTTRKMTTIGRCGWMFGQDNYKLHWVSGRLGS